MKRDRYGRTVFDIASTIGDLTQMAKTWESQNQIRARMWAYAFGQKQTEIFLIKTKKKKNQTAYVSWPPPKAKGSVAISIHVFLCHEAGRITDDQYQGEGLLERNDLQDLWACILLFAESEGHFEVLQRFIPHLGISSPSSIYEHLLDKRTTPPDFDDFIHAIKAKAGFRGIELLKRYPSLVDGLGISYIFHDEDVNLEFLRFVVLHYPEKTIDRLIPISNLTILDHVLLYSHSFATDRLLKDLLIPMTPVEHCTDESVIVRYGAYPTNTKNPERRDDLFQIYKDNCLACVKFLHFEIRMVMKPKELANLIYEYAEIHVNLVYDFMHPFSMKLFELMQTAPCYRFISKHCEKNAITSQTIRGWAQKSGPQFAHVVHLTDFLKKKNP